MSNIPNITGFLQTAEALQSHVKNQEADMVAIRIRSFEGQILFFNGMYKLPVAKKPSLLQLSEPASLRLMKFKETLLKEIEEGDDIINKLAAGHYDSAADALTDIADWLTDIQIYCASEMVKFGLPIAECQRIVMQSNFSKLQADGTVKYDANGKVEKGPGYWKPEPLLKDLIEDRMQDDDSRDSA